MKQCDCVAQVIEGIKESYPGYEDITPPIELLSGKIYLNFTAEIPYRGKKKQVDIPILLSKCPFCGKPYVKEEEAMK